MIDKFLETKVRDYLAARGVRINGDDPWDIQVHNPKIYRRVLLEGNIGLLESYMDEWWDCEQLDELVNKILSKRLFKIFIAPTIGSAIREKLFNMQNHIHAKKVAEHHYDLGNDLYTRMLDKRMVYTCGYWKEALDLDAAQEAKLDLICKKIGLEKGMKVLDLGCGWGSFAKFAAERYGAEVVGVNISKKQVEMAKILCQGLPVDIRLKDYRDIRGLYDRVVGIGICEHVGFKNYRKLMEVSHARLKEDGLFLLHSIGLGFQMQPGINWGTKYIFPNSMLPSVKQIGEAIDDLFVMEDWHNFGADYDKTLMVWNENFDKRWPEIESKYGKRFYRMWRFYLLVFAGLFRRRYFHLWQVVLSKTGVIGGYCSVR